jgi:hypothetical protein
MRAHSCPGVLLFVCITAAQAPAWAESIGFETYPAAADAEFKFPEGGDPAWRRYFVQVLQFSEHQ